MKVNIQNHNRRILCCLLVVAIMATMTVPAFAVENPEAQEMEFLYAYGHGAIMSALYATGLPCDGTPEQENERYAQIKQILTESGYEFPVIDGITDPFPIVYDLENGMFYIEQAWIEQLVIYAQENCSYDAVTSWDNAVIDTAEQKVYLPVSVYVAPTQRLALALEGNDFKAGQGAFAGCASTGNYGTFAPYQISNGLSETMSDDAASPGFDDLMEILPVAVLAFVGYIVISKGISLVWDAVQNA